MGTVKNYDDQGIHQHVVQISCSDPSLSIFLGWNKLIRGLCHLHLYHTRIYKWWNTVRCLLIPKKEQMSTYVWKVTRPLCKKFRTSVFLFVHGMFTASTVTGILKRKIRYWGKNVPNIWLYLSLPNLQILWAFLIKMAKIGLNTWLILRLILVSSYHHQISWSWHLTFVDWLCQCDWPALSNVVGSEIVQNQIEKSQ